jgi:hypothetical protein
MIAKYTYSFICDALKRFNDTTGLIEVAEILEVNPDNLSKAIRRYGFTVPKIKRPNKNRINLPTQKIVSLYSNGMSEVEIAKQFQVSRPVIRARLIESNCQIRSHSEANIVSMSRMTLNQRQQRVQSANNAIRGMKRSHDEKIRRAITKTTQFSPQWVGYGEDEFAKALTELNIKFSRQTAVDIYNVDFIIGNIAVELKCGATSRSNVKSEYFSGRIKELSDRGYIVCYIAFKNVSAFISSLDYIISNLNILASNPSSSSKYWMIWCRFNEFTTLRNELGQFTSKPVPINLMQSIKGFDI